MKRSEAKELTEKYEGRRPTSLEFLLKILGIIEKEWRNIALSHSIPPYKHNFANEKDDKPLWDLKLWNWNP